MTPLVGSQVIAESYTQWVVEDAFPLGRPAWEEVGALFVADVHPYEMMKLRLLNAGHSAISYCSYLIGDAPSLECALLLRGGVAFLDAPSQRPKGAFIADLPPFCK